MKKLKTKKSITKRFKITKKKKMIRRVANQNHFNARATGNQKRKKHQTQKVHQRDVKKLLKLI